MKWKNIDFLVVVKTKENGVLRQIGFLVVTSGPMMDRLSTLHHRCKSLESGGV